MGNNDFLFNNFNRILELLSGDELSQSVDHICKELPNLLNQSTLDIESTILDKYKSLSNLIIDKSAVIVGQFPIFLTLFDRKLTPLLSRDCFLLWDKTNSDFLLGNFECLQENLYRLFISLSNITSFFKSNISNLPDKSFLANIVNEITLQISSKFQSLDKLSNLPEGSYFESKFFSLNNAIENQLAKIEDNDFLVRNFNRILEMLSELSESFSPF
jgi:hypothetical protein